MTCATRFLWPPAVVAAALCACRQPPEVGSGPLPRPIPVVLNEGICDTIGNGQLCARAIEARQLPRTHGRVRREGKRVCFERPGGAPICFADDTATETGTWYSYLGTFPAPAFHVLWAQLFEDYAILLVNAESGKKVWLDGIPVPSRTGRYLALATKAEGMRGSSNRVSVWALAGDSLVEEWAFEPQDWSPDFPQWSNDSTFRVVRYSVSGEGQRTFLGSYIVMRVGGVWTRYVPDLLAWARREFGVGVVKYADMERYATQDTIFAASRPDADTVATLDSRELCFRATRQCVLAYERMIEYAYEVPGWAILDFTPDSTWAQITLDPRAGDPALVGWVALRHGSAEPLLWRDLLPRHPLFFLLPDSIRFHPQPYADSTVSLPLASGDEVRRFDYIMRPVTVQGRWLQVVVETPSTMCKSPVPEARRDTVWVEYLTPAGRPRVFFYTRGC